MSVGVLALEAEVLGWRADGRPVLWIRGGAESDGGAGAAGGESAAAGGVSASAGTGVEGAASAANTGGAAPGGADGDGSEEIEFSEESFKKLVDDLNKERAEREAEKADLQRKLHAASQKAATYRVRAKGLAEMLGQDDTQPKGQGKQSGAGPAGQAGAQAGPDPEVARLAAELKSTQTRLLQTDARSALLEAGVSPKHAARLVKMIDLNLEGSDDVPDLAEQVAELKADMPELFGAVSGVAAAVAPASAGNGTGTPARVLRAAPAVAGRGAAGRGAEAPKPLTSKDVLANRALGRPDDYQG